MADENQFQKPIVVWKDLKFLFGITLIILSILIGEFGKGLSIIKFYIPKYLITGISLYAFSYVLLFLGIFLVGWETVKLIRDRIHHHIKKTYVYTKGLPKKGYNYTKKLHKKLTK